MSEYINFVMGNPSILITIIIFIVCIVIGYFGDKYLKRNKMIENYEKNNLESQNVEKQNSNVKQDVLIKPEENTNDLISGKTNTTVNDVTPSLNNSFPVENSEQTQNTIENAAANDASFNNNDQTPVAEPFVISQVSDNIQNTSAVEPIINNDFNSPDKEVLSPMNNENSNINSNVDVQTIPNDLYPKQENDINNMF